MQIYKKISYTALTIIFILIRLVVLAISTKMRTRIGKMIGSIGFRFANKRKAITIDNLTNAFPEKNQVEIEQIACGVFQSFVITFLELLVMANLTDKQLHKLIDFGNGLELIEGVRTRKKGTLFLSGHFGNWELIAYAFGKFTQQPITIVVKPQANESANNILNRIRKSGGNTLVSMYNAARTIISEIRSGGVIALLADQSATADNDIFVDFFGRPASTYKVVAELALRYEIPIVMGFAIRQPDGNYKAEIIELDYSDIIAQNLPKSKAITQLTERHTKALEGTIRKYPEQWAWMHRRWKHHLPQ